MQVNIITVKLEDKFYPGTFSGKEYTYYSDLKLIQGDIVKCPTAHGRSYGIVKVITTDVNLVEYEKKLSYALKQILTKIDKELFLSKAS